MKHTATYTTLHFILIKIIGDVLYFPIWWYTKGAGSTWQWFVKKLATSAKNLSLVIWLKHIFVPMYAQYNFWGRIISFFMRVIVLIMRLVAFCFNFIFFALITILYIVILPAVVIMFIRSLFWGKQINTNRNTNFHKSQINTNCTYLSYFYILVFLF